MKRDLDDSSLAPHFVAAGRSAWSTLRGKWRWASADLRENETLNADVQRLAKIGSWSWHVGKNEMRGSAEAYRIFGLPEAEAGTPIPLEQVTRLVHSAWQERMREAMQACIKVGTPFDIEIQAHVVSHADVCLRVLGTAERNAQGRAIRIHGAVQDLSERKESAERYRQLSAQLSTTLESVTDAFFTIDQDWRFTYINPEAERLLNCPRSQLVGKLLWDAFPGQANSVFVSKYRKALSDMRTVRFEAESTVLRAWLQVVAYPSAQGLAVYFRDITESRNVRNALLESEERYRLLFETSLDAILQASPSGRITRANPAACTMFGLSEDQFRDLGSAELVAPEDERFGELLEKRHRTGSAASELTMIRGNGSRFEVDASSSEFTTTRGKVLVNMVVRDITQQHAHQEEILLLNAELTERVRLRTAQLESANAELKGFAHSLAHDLRAPIATIVGFSSNLHDSLGAGTERQQHFTRRIQAAALRMNEFIAALLSLASVSQARLNFSDVDLSLIASSVLADLKERDTLRAVATDIQEGVHAWGDPRLLRMVLENLLGNAWKFTGKTGHAAISFTAVDRPGDGMVYCVKDNGAGFDMAYAEKLFGNFQRLHSESEFPGTGIGLANVRRIILRHGGTVWAESAVDAGACFSFTLNARATIATSTVP